MKYILTILPIFIMLTLAPALAGNGNVLAGTSEQAIEQAQISSQAALCASVRIPYCHVIT